MVLTRDFSLEVHQHWLLELRRKVAKKYGNVEDFSGRHKIRSLSAFWFFKGNPVPKDDFRAICNALKVDPLQVQKPFPIKLLKLHCTYAGFIRARIKRIETRKTSQALGKHYRDWVAIASCHSPTTPDWSLIERVRELGTMIYSQAWPRKLKKADLYLPGHILAIARVANSWEMTPENMTDSPIEQLVGGWEPGRWAFELGDRKGKDLIIPTNPIPYNIPGQGAIYLNEEHGDVYEQICQLITSNQLKPKGEK
jgi:hypothetical protein